MKMYECVVGENDDGDFIWSVYETATEQIIQSFLFEEDALKFIKFSSNGGAFQGYTPSFMTIKGYKPSDINEEFSASFEIE